MSYHPDDEPGLVKEEICPYCGSEDYEPIGKWCQEYGIVATYESRECKCNKCGKVFEEIWECYGESYHYGNAKTEEGEEE